MEGNGDIDRQWGDDLLSEVGAPPVIAVLANSASPEPELSGGAELEVAFREVIPVFRPVTTV